MSSSLNADEIIAERFQQIIDQQLYLNPMNKYDHAIWYILSTRCEADMNGFESIFEQQHTNEELIELELALRNIKDDELAVCFEKIRILLEKNNFWTDNGYDINKLPDNDQKIFFELKKKITQNDRMWDLDAKILQILGSPD